MDEPQTHCEHSAVQRLLIRLVEAVCRHPWQVLAVALVATAASVFGSLRLLEYRTNRDDLTSPDKAFQKRWRQYLAEFGNDDDIVTVVHGQDRQHIEAGLEALAAAVKKQPDRFDRVFYKVDLRPLQNRSLLFLDTGDIQKVLDNLKSMALLLETGPIGWRSLTLYSLLHEARGRAARLLPGQPLSPDDAQYFSQLLALARTATDTISNPDNYRNPWQSVVSHSAGEEKMLTEPQYFFSGDGQLAMFLARPIPAEGGSTPCQKSVAAMRGILNEVRPGFADLEFGLTGMPVLEDDEVVATEQDTHLASWLALAGVAAIYFLFFRGFCYPPLTVATLLIGTAWASGWLTLTVGHLNILSATFAMMLFGLGDYGILWVTRYEQDRRAGCDVLSALRNTAGSVGTGVLTAATTTALAFFAAMLADFQAVTELGWIAGSGVLWCAFACFTAMPALLIIFDRRKMPRSMGSLPTRANTQGVPRLQPWLPRLARRPRLVIGISLGLTFVLVWFGLRVPYDHNLLHMQARGLDSVAWELRLIEHDAGASWNALSYTDSPQEALALKKRFEQLPVVSRVVEIASLMPPDQGRKLEQLREIQTRLRGLPEQKGLPSHVAPEIPTLQRELTGLMSEFFAKNSSQQLLVELQTSLLALNEKLSQAPALAADRIRHFEDCLGCDLVTDLQRLKSASTPAPIELADLPVGLRERFLGQTGKWLLQVFGQGSLWEYPALAQFVQQIRTVDRDATGKPFSTLEGLRSMKDGFLWAGLYALLAIVVVLVIDFRRLGHTIVALAPMAMGVIMTLGIMGICGLPLNPANMIALPLILGVGVDNGVHVLHDYLGRRRGESYTLSHIIGRGVFVKALTTIVGFGVLMIARHQGLFSLGFTLSLGVTCCMFSALIFLPAVLRLISLRYWVRANADVLQHDQLRRAA